MSNEKNYTKTEAIKIMLSCAQDYQKRLNNRRFLLAYRFNNSIRYHLVCFRSKNYLHLTGVDTFIPPKFFYKKCLENKLNDKDFEFDEYNQAHLKLAVLDQMPDLLYGKGVRGDFLRIGQYLEVDYFIGVPGRPVSLGFREVEDDIYDAPVSLYKENINKLTVSTQKIIGIWRLDRNHSIATYIDKDEDEAELTKQLLAINAPLKPLIPDN